ncbi:helix-turn-helix domain-containing protein [Pseudoscardovia radai]|uniref:helix-turn-helix domain-containing protein n=1 Tax=Pseudoscardovia radai TaxID=987066 RepID=UPI0039952C8D
MSEQLGTRMRELMQQNGYSQKQLAELAGLTEATVSRYVSGEREPKAETLADIATALHTSTDYLLGRESSSDLDSAYTILARNASMLTADQKTVLIRALFNEPEGKE